MNVALSSASTVEILYSSFQTVVQCLTKLTGIIRIEDEDSKKDFNIRGYPE